MFGSVKDLDGEHGYVFVHMHHHPERRARDKLIVRDLGDRPEFKVIPDARSARLYDNKRQQAKELARWLPRTWVFKDAQKARAFLKKRPPMPLVSKASVGSGSHNVRLIEDGAAGLREIKRALREDSPGIALRYDERQRGYLIWQEFCPGNLFDYRVIVIGRDQRMILRRHNRDDRPMASGSGRLERVSFPDADASSALEFANEVAANEGFLWAGLDIVREAPGGRWRLLETTVSWTLPAYYGYTFVNSKRNGAQVFEVLLGCIERGDFSC